MFTDFLFVLSLLGIGMLDAQPKQKRQHRLWPLHTKSCGPHRVRQLRGLSILLFVVCLVGLLGAIGCGAGECSFDGDCPDDLICRGGACTKNLIGQLCQSSQDCKPGEQCLNQQCIAPECQENAQEACFDGNPASKGIGLCQGGFRSCTSGRWSACIGQILPSSELCDQLDNDCNGQIDDNPSCSSTCKDGDQRPCYTGPAATRGMGTCRAGTESCQNSQWGPCLGQVLPADKDICNDNLDNNCNGQVDEGCGPCQAGQSRPCYTGPAATRDVGTCKAGTETCQNGQWSICAGEIKPTQEVCDQLDNDCNGQVDDASGCTGGCQVGQTQPCYTGSPGTKGVGSCKEGSQTCQSGPGGKNQWSACAGEVQPAGEKCGDQIDNNCNGQVDEGCGVCTDGATETCYSGQQGCSKSPNGSYACNTPCRSGTRSCQGGQWTSCQNEKLPFPREVCDNNVDDDCNGQVDDGCGACQAGQTQACYAGPAGTQGVGECKAGQQSCQGNNWGPCIGEVVPSNELCGDNKDNNCNGTADENCSTKLHQTCTQNSDCDPGQVCLSSGTQGYCFQDCSTNTTVCQSNADGRTACIPVSTTSQGQTISMCVKEVGPNAACNPIQSVFCQQNYACIGGSCKPVQVSTEGQPCDGQATPPKICATGNTCVAFGSGYDSICLKECDPNNASSCTAGFRCVALQSNGGACVQVGCTSDAQCNYSNHICVQDANLQTNICAPQPQPGPVGFAGVCDPTVANQRCQSGLFCLFLQGAPTGHCSMICTGSGRGNCPSVSPGTTQCVVLNSQGQKACLISCTATCPSGLRCQNVSGTFLCFP